MRVFVKNSVLFLICSASIYLFIFAVLTFVKVGGTPLIYRSSETLNWKGGNSYVKFGSFDRNANYDFVFIGSSHAYRGYDMSVFEAAGLKVFNLGSSAQTPLNSFAIIKDLIEEGTAKAVVIDVYADALETNGLESTADLIQNYPGWSAALHMAWAMKDPRVINMLTLRVLMSQSEPLYEDECNGVSGSCLVSDSLEVLPSYSKGRPLVPKSLQLDFLKSSIHFLQGKGVDVILCDHPSPKGSDSNRHAQHHEFMKAFAKKYNVELIAIQDLPELDPQHHFYDHTHLNAAGARLFSKKLLEQLLERTH